MAIYSPVCISCERILSDPRQASISCWIPSLDPLPLHLPHFPPNAPYARLLSPPLGHPGPTSIRSLIAYYVVEYLLPSLPSRVFLVERKKKKKKKKKEENKRRKPTHHRPEISLPSASTPSMGLTTRHPLRQHTRRNEQTRSRGGNRSMLLHETSSSPSPTPSRSTPLVFPASIETDKSVFPEPTKSISIPKNDAHARTKLSFLPPFLPSLYIFKTYPPDQDPMKETVSRQRAFRTTDEYATTGIFFGDPSSLSSSAPRPQAPRSRVEFSSACCCQMADSMSMLMLMRGRGV